MFERKTELLIHEHRICVVKRNWQKRDIISEKETTTVKTDTSKTHTNVVDYDTQSPSKEPNQINTTKKGISPS